MAHYIAGVLDLDAMIAIVNSLSQSAELALGSRVKSLRGSVRGVVVQIREDGKVVWKSDATGAELVALPESLVLE